MPRKVPGPRFWHLFHVGYHALAMRLVRDQSISAREKIASASRCAAGVSRDPIRVTRLKGVTLVPSLIGMATKGIDGLPEKLSTTGRASGAIASVSSRAARVNRKDEVEIRRLGAGSRNSASRASQSGSKACHLAQVSSHTATGCSDRSRAAKAEGDPGAPPPTGVHPRSPRLNHRVGRTRAGQVKVQTARAQMIAKQDRCGDRHFDMQIGMVFLQRYDLGHDQALGRAGRRAHPKANRTPCARPAGPKPSHQRPTWLARPQHRGCWSKARSMWQRPRPKRWSRHSWRSDPRSSGRGAVR